MPRFPGRLGTNSEDLRLSAAAERECREATVETPLLPREMGEARERRIDWRAARLARGWLQIQMKGGEACEVVVREVHIFLTLLSVS